MDSIIQLRNIYKSFNNKRILNNFNLDISNNSKVLIFGESGIGKSTVFKLILGFIMPDKGNVIYKGKYLNKDNVWSMRGDIAYINQSNDIGEGRVIDYFNHVLSYKINQKNNCILDNIDELLDYFKLNNDILISQIMKLSGGEKQRIAIILSILLKRDIFLLDEITSSLDIELKKKTIDYFLNIDKTVLIISHDEHWMDTKDLQIIRMGNERSN